MVFTSFASYEQAQHGISQGLKVILGCIELKIKMVEGKNGRH